MNGFCPLLAVTSGLTLLTPALAVDRAGPVPVQLAANPALSPDGKRAVFSWAGDLWMVSSRGGLAKRLSTHPAYEGDPVFSPDGTRLAFTSNRSGKDQVYLMTVDGGLPSQLTFHSEGSRVVEWYPDGESLLIAAAREAATHSPLRFYRIAAAGRGPEHLLFDAEGHSGSLSPDGKRLLFCREGGDLYRKGYRGSKASQIWLAEGLETAEPTFRKLVARESEARSPMWKADGSGFYYLGDHGEEGCFDVWEHDLASGTETALTRFKDDPAITPAIARDGSAIVFRREFDLTILPLAGKRKQKIPRVLDIVAAPDTLPEDEVRRSLTKADNLSFSPDGLEVAFIAGGDVWVMDTELREPVAVTQTPAEEREPVFSADGESLFFIRDEGTSVDLWSVKRSDGGGYWWRNTTFKEKRLTGDGSNKQDLRTVPGGKRLSWVAGGGSLWAADEDGNRAAKLFDSWNTPQYDWSPDGKWIAYAVSDNDFNRDVWIAPADGSSPPYNLSRHPDTDANPAWSPDGRILAFTGRRYHEETDLYYVHLRLEDEEKDKRDRTLESALKKMEAARKKPEPPKASGAPAAPPKPAASNGDEKREVTGPPKSSPPPSSGEAAKPVATSSPKAAAPGPEVKIDFDRLAERIHRVSIPDTTEMGLFWSHDSKRLAFAAEIKGVKGTYTVSFPDPSSPALLLNKTGSLARWMAKDDTILWLVDGLPASFSKGSLRTFPFTARQSHPRAGYQLAGFRQIWRTMRDNWYDETLNHLDWDAIRSKYEEAAANAPDSRAFDRVVAMMLGELNGSHLGFKSASDTFAPKPTQGWSEETAHPGVTLDRTYPGPGWKVASVIPRGPADEASSRLLPGDLIASVNGLEVSMDTDPTLALNGAPGRELRLEVKRPREAKGDGGEAKDGKPSPESETIEVVMRPISASKARELRQDARVEERRALVDRLSKGRIGYVFVERMDWSEFIRFEEEIFARGHGKEGLLIDVRDNGGGFTADHLLTVLTPAEHAVTVPRGGGPGYPQDRRIYATWSRPLTVLCNQNSFSNAEIFSHAVKELGRGKLVGVTTAGGVVSTGSASIRDMGSLRIPFRGWYRKSDGADLELNGAVPDATVWPGPSDEVKEHDPQIERAVELLLADVEAAKAAGQPSLVPASRRKGAEPGPSK